MTTTKISPSILAADYAKFGDEVRAITDAGADMIHVDVMDGHFVPNITFGPGLVKALKPHSHLPFDVHLMITPADPYLAEFAEAGADLITVHPEAGPHLHRTLQTITGLGCTPGVALNPATPLEVLDPIMDMIGLVLVMSVNPGFGGQSFLESQLPRIESIRNRIERTGRDIILEVDGGVKADNAAQVISAGATSLVAGTAVFKGGPEAYADNIAALKAAGGQLA